MSCRFTTCLDSRKTGHRVQQSVINRDAKQYGWPLPECLRSVEEGHEWDENGRTRRNEALGPFVLDTLKVFGRDLADSFLCKYELRDLPGAATFTVRDRHLLGPYQQIVEKLSTMESLPRVHINEFIQKARDELRKIEKHVEDMKSEWAKGFRTASKKKSGFTQTRMVDDLQRRFNSGPDAPHISLLGDVPAIRASYAYERCRAEDPKFAFAMASGALCNIKARELGGTTFERKFADLVTIPKIAVRTLSALRPQTRDV